MRRMFGPAPRISVDGKRLDGDDDDDLEEASDPEEEVPIRRGVIREAALAVTEQGVKLQHARRRIADLENAMKERDEFEANAREHLRSAEESARQLRTLSERLESEKKELARSEARRAELERDLDTVRGELETERGARRDAEARVVANGWDADDAKRSADQSRLEERRSAVAFAELTARLEDSRATLASTEAALREARYGLQTECNRAAASEAELPRFPRSGTEFGSISTTRGKSWRRSGEVWKTPRNAPRRLRRGRRRSRPRWSPSNAGSPRVRRRRRPRWNSARARARRWTGSSSSAKSEARNAPGSRRRTSVCGKRGRGDRAFAEKRGRSRRRVRGWPARARDLESKLRTSSADLEFVKARTRGRRARTRLRRESVKGERRGDRALTGPERGDRARARQEPRALRVRLCAHREAGGGGGGARRDASSEGRPRRRKRVGQTRARDR